jgi:LysM repeat protein
VINWKEEPLEGWVVTLTSDIEGFTPITTTSAPEPDEDDPNEYGNNNYGNNGYNNKYAKKSYPYPVVDPALEEGEFKFTEGAITAAGNGAQPGTFTATIESRLGWEGVTPTTISFPIGVDEDGCVKIRFKMRQIVHVDVYKIDADHQPLGDWIIRAIPGPGNLFASPQEEETTDPITSTTPVTGGIASFTLTPGLWIFTEQAPEQEEGDPRNSYQPVVPPTGRQELLVPDDLDPITTTLRIVFKNELVTGCFIVEKLGLTTDPEDPDAPPSALGESYDVAGWGFKLERKDGTVARQGVTDAQGRLRFDNLPLGPYNLIEEDRPGWQEVSDREVEVGVTGDGCDPDSATGEQVVTFENRQDNSGFCIEGRKIDANDGWPIAGWEIALDPLDEGGVDLPNAFTRGDGHFEFVFESPDYRLPGAEYQVCEIGQDGWLAHNPTCQTVRLPEWPGACVQLADFVNQQVGHSESEQHPYPEYPEGGKGSEYPSQQPSGSQSEYPSQQPSGPQGEYPSQQPSGPQSEYPSQQPSGPEYGSQGGQQCSSYHTVQAGEGLYDIGRQYQKSPQQMIEANPSVSGDDMVIYVGQNICIP